jgi:hypothetical protein
MKRVKEPLADQGVFCFLSVHFEKSYNKPEGPAKIPAAGYTLFQISPYARHRITGLGSFPRMSRSNFHYRSTDRTLHSLPTLSPERTPIDIA